MAPNLHSLSTNRGYNDVLEEYKVKKIEILFAGCALAFVAMPSAFATVDAELRMSNGIQTITVADASCGPSCVNVGYSTAPPSLEPGLGSWNIMSTTGTLDENASPFMDLNSLDHTNGGATGQTLTIEWSANGLTLPSAGFELNIGGTLGAHGTLTAALYGGNSDNLFDLSNEIGTTLDFKSPPILFGATEDAYLSSIPSGPYSLTEVVTINFAGNAGQTSFNYSIDAIPEPAGVLLLGSAMLFTVGAIRRKRAARKNA